MPEFKRYKAVITVNMHHEVDFDSTTMRPGETTYMTAMRLSENPSDWETDSIAVEVERKL